MKHPTDNELEAMAHTTGPWEEITPADGLWPPRVFSGSKIIAMVDNSDMTQEEKISNARLIAAAPELLSELANLLDCVQTYAPEFMHGIPTKEHVQNARAAIARATGEKP